MRIPLLMFSILFLPLSLFSQRFYVEDDDPPKLHTKESSMGYVKTGGKGLMGQYFGTAHGFSAEYFWFLGQSNVSIGLDGAFSVYGNETNQELYYFDNSEYGMVDVNVINGLSNFGINTRFHLKRTGIINPYIISRVGYSMFTSSLYIEDPRESHTSSCPVPLESEILLSSSAPVYSFGAGIQLDIGKYFTRRPSGVLLDIRTQFITGAPVRYMSFQPPVTLLDHAQDLYIGFASEIEPDLVHDYHVGYTYSSPIRLIETKFQLSFRF